MLKPLVMTVIAPDKPGLVESLSAAVSRHGGNWLESRMAQLSGYFAGVVQITVPESAEQALVAALEELEKSAGLSLVVHASVGAAAAVDGEMVEIELIGQDRPGIIAQISRVLASHAVNVEELDSACTNAPMTGETLFTASARLRIPPGCEIDNLKRDLERIAADLLVDVNFRKAEPG